MKNLVIVESPTKARTIGRFLGGDYTIKASMGHVMDLPKSKLGIDEKTLEPAYEVVSEKSMVIADLKDGIKGVDSIIIATDPDREGEAIAAHVKELLKIAGEKKFKRIVFHEITKEAIEDALSHPRSIDDALVDAQTARRVLDRLVGYKISPVLWQKVRRGLSAGRVQSVALRLIVEREREIEKFKKEKYWSIHGLFEKETKITDFVLIEINDKKIEIQKIHELYDGDYKIGKTIIDELKKAQEIVEDLKTNKFAVSEILQKEAKRSPYPPYITSTLQQDASHKFGFAGRRTMSLAQKLYEEGFITYHRTDSVTMAKSAVTQIRKYVEKKFGNKYLYPTERVYKTKQKLAQEAHEAIRPTNVGAAADIVGKDLGRDFARLYELIWARAVATQMSDAITESTTVFLDSKKDSGDKYRFKANGSVLIFDGFLKVTPLVLSDNLLPDFEKDEELSASGFVEKEHETLPPPRYNEPSLIATLEEKEIGRPSTYATIVSTIEGRKYIERKEGRFIPTPVGIAVNDFLVKNFSTIDDIPFTADMENELDGIANEKKEWKPVIRKFYEDLIKSLEKVKGAERVKIATEEIDEKCPKCGSPLVIRYGKFGKFLSCSTFPVCDFTKPYIEEVGIPCPKCGGLSSDLSAKDLSTAEASAKGGQIILRNTRKGRKFYGCSNYPKCDFAAWKLQDIEKFKK